MSLRRIFDREPEYKDTSDGFNSPRFQRLTASYHRTCEPRAGCCLRTLRYNYPTLAPAYLARLPQSAKLFLGSPRSGPPPVATSIGHRPGAEAAAEHEHCGGIKATGSCKVTGPFLSAWALFSLFHFAQVKDQGARHDAHPAIHNTFVRLGRAVTRRAVSRRPKKKSGSLELLSMSYKKAEV